LQNVVLQRSKKWLIKHQSEVPQGNALRRLTVLSGLLGALIKGVRASLSELGRHMEDPTDLESRVKKAKRWLQNKWTDVTVHFIPYLLPILHSLSKAGELVLAIDGSCVGKDCMALMVSVIWRRRAIPICWVVRKAPKGHFPEHMHVAIIGQVAMLMDSILEQDCRIFLLGDAEFDGCELQQSCLAHGWEYVLKTAKDTLVADHPNMEHASAFGHLAASIGQKSLFLPQMYVAKQGFGPVNVLFWHDRTRYDRPLYLLTSLEYGPQAETYYRKRYHIETFFGDIKSRGFHIHKTRIEEPQTLFNLLIVASLAFIICILFEFDARTSAQLGKFCRKDRIDSLSVFQIGLRAVRFYARHAMNLSFQFSKNFP
jgi:hypothetical protein